MSVLTGVRQLSSIVLKHSTHTSKRTCLWQKHGQARNKQESKKPEALWKSQASAMNKQTAIKGTPVQAKQQCSHCKSRNCLNSWTQKQTLTNAPRNEACKQTRQKKLMPSFQKLQAQSQWCWSRDRNFVQSTWQSPFKGRFCLRSWAKSRKVTMGGGTQNMSNL